MMHFWTGFEKQALDEDTKRHIGDVQAGILALHGANQLHKSIDPLTGSKTVYHGTSPEKADSIRRHGLKPSYGGSGTSKGDKRFEPNSKGKIHVTDLKSVAKVYSDPDSYQVANKAGKKNLKEHALLIKTTLKPAGNGVVKARIPYGDFKNNFKEDAYSAAATRAHHSTSRIDPHHIQGGEGYRKQQFKDLKNVGAYIKKHPGRFMGGVGRAAIGVGGLAYGAHRALTSHRRRRSDEGGGESQT